MQEFVNKVVEELERLSQGEYVVRHHKVVKVNDCMFDVVNLFKSNENIAKSIYLEEYYKLYLHGMNIENVAKEIMYEVEKSRRELSECKCDILEQLQSYESIKDRIVMRLLNKEKNQEFLKDKCYVPYLDMVLCFYVLISGKENDTTGFSLPWHIVEEWGVTIKELYEKALENMQVLLPAQMISMEDMLYKILSSEEEFMNRPKTDTSMYVLTNVCKVNGAAVIMYPNLLKNFAQENGFEAIILIPSSIHEFILIPKIEGNISEKKCREMLIEVNSEMVLPFEILGEEVYVYRLASDSIEIWEQ